MLCWRSSVRITQPIFFKSVLHEVSHFKHGGMASEKAESGCQGTSYAWLLPSYGIVPSVKQRLIIDLYFSLLLSGIPGAE
jgi:hypothetical protein